MINLLDRSRTGRFRAEMRYVCLKRMTFLKAYAGIVGELIPHNASKYLNWVLYLLERNSGSITPDSYLS